MKKGIVLIFLMQLMVGPAYSARGGEVGKGGNGGSEPKIHSGEVEGRVIKAASAQSSDLIGFCHTAIGILRDALEQSRQMFVYGDLQGARNILTQGLVEASKSFDPKLEEKPLTHNAILRGLRLAGIFQQVCPEGDPSCASLEMRVALFFMSGYYGYILNTVSVLDETYYIPYITHHSHCRNLDCLPQDYRHGFFTNYREAAVVLLEFYNGNGSGLPDALARNTYELRLAELVFKWAADDLSSDLFRRHFSCAIEELNRASKAIADFNAGNTSRFKTSTQAVRFARAKSQKVASELGSPNSCNVTTGGYGF